MNSSPSSILFPIQPLFLSFLSLHSHLPAPPLMPTCPLLLCLPVPSPSIFLGPLPTSGSSTFLFFYSRSTPLLFLISCLLPFRTISPSLPSYHPFLPSSIPLSHFVHISLQVLKKFCEMAGEPSCSMKCDIMTCDSEMDSAHRNYALLHYMKEMKVSPT